VEGSHVQIRNPTHPPHPPLPLGGDAVSPLHQYLATAPEPSYDQNGLHFEHSLTLGLGFEVLGLGFEVLGLGCDVLGLGFSVLGLGFEVLGHPKLPRFWVTQGPKSRKAALQV